MQDIVSIGQPPWTRADIIAHLDEFEALYPQRPIQDNQGGMQAPHMFAVWFMAKQLAPDLIVESGIWRGQSTWLLEQACPDADLVSLDLNLDNRDYISKRATYSDADFVEQDWGKVSDKTLVFFDDHQNAYKRLQQCRWFGFKHIIFEDNYPVSQGDCYSLKKAFAHAGFEPGGAATNVQSNSVLTRALNRAARIVGLNTINLTPQFDLVRVRPNGTDADMLRKQIGVYYEFPPVFKSAQTRWGDTWDDANYPTPDPLLSDDQKAIRKQFADDAMFYTWICYAQLK